jgi:hypothetical protein
MTRFVARWITAARNRWRGWDEQDVASLSQKLVDPAVRSGVVLELTKREYRAVPEFNRRVFASIPGAVFYPLLAQVAGRGLRQLRRAGPP